MPVSSTVSVPYGRSFTSSNLGGRWAGSVAIDSEFAASGSITLTATVIRETTWWIQFTGDLELLPNTLGARNDLVVTITHPSAGSITGDISGYLTADQRDGTTSQATITARDTAAQSAWGTAVSDDSDALSITLVSDSSGPAAPPTPATSSGFRLGGKTITKAYLGETEIERAYLGETLLFGSTGPPRVAEISLVRTGDNPNTNPFGIWSDGTTMWVNDLRRIVFAYSLENGARDAPKEFNLIAANGSPEGMWSDGTTIWVMDNSDPQPFAYTLATGSRDSSKEFTTVSANSDRQGIWSDGTTMWVLDTLDDRLYAYTLSTGSRDTTKEFDLHSDNGNSAGIWSDGTTMWVGDWNDGKVYAYTLSNGSRDSSKEFDLTGTESVLDIWSDGTILWVLDDSVTSKKINTYVLATGALRS